MSTSIPSSCAAIRADLDEPLLATAPERAASWLLVEHPGPWPSTGLPSDLPPEVAAVIKTATTAGVRPQLVRRVHGRRQAALGAGVPPGFGTLAAEGVVLVCTHGRRDVCCARLGRPLALLLDAQIPGQVWETTHVGGDRFAPDVVALPDGSYHGAVTAADVPALAEAVTSGRVLRSRLRGRAGLPAAAQAADLFLREHTGQSVLDAIVVLAVTPAPSGAVCVELLDGASRWCAHVISRPGKRRRLTSCAGSGTHAAPAAFELLSLGRLA